MTADPIPETADAPTPEEEEDIVALLDTDPEPKRYWLPQGKDPETGEPRFSDAYYVDVKVWTAKEKLDHEGAGLQYFRRERDRTRTQEVTIDIPRRTEALINASIVGYRLRLKRQDIEYKPGSLRPWQYLCQLPPGVLDWITETVNKHHGLQRKEEQGEA